MANSEAVRKLEAVGKTDAKIKKAVSKRLNRRTNAREKNNLVNTTLYAMLGVVAIIPALIIGLMTFFGAGFVGAVRATSTSYAKMVE